MKLALAVCNSTAFTFYAPTKFFIAEASDLGAFDLFQRMYDDACDVGFAMRSHKTGEISHWALEREVRDNDNDITSWIFSPTQWSVNKFPTLEGVRVEVLND